LRQQKKIPKTPFSAISRKKTTQSSNLTITKSTEIKKDNLLRQQKKTPRTPFSAISRKKTTQSSNLTITKNTEIMERQPFAAAKEDTQDTFFGEQPKKDNSLIQPHDY
jgi:hypothetical protein